MAWTTPTFAMLARRMADMPALRRVAQQQSLDIEVIAGEVIASTVRLVRGYVPRDTARGEEGSIPPEAEDAFWPLCRLSLITYIPGGSPLDDDARKAMRSGAMSILRDMSNRSLTITPPDDTAEDVQETAPGTSGGDTPMEW